MLQYLSKKVAEGAFHFQQAQTTCCTMEQKIYESDITHMSYQGEVRCWRFFSKSKSQVESVPVLGLMLGSRPHWGQAEAASLGAPGEAPLAASLCLTRLGVEALLAAVAPWSSLGLRQSCLLLLLAVYSQAAWRWVSVLQAEQAGPPSTVWRLYLPPCPFSYLPSSCLLPLHLLHNYPQCFEGHQAA